MLLKECPDLMYSDKALQQWGTETVCWCCISCCKKTKFEEIEDASIGVAEAWRRTMGNVAYHCTRKTYFSVFVSWVILLWHIVDISTDIIYLSTEYFASTSVHYFAWGLLLLPWLAQLGVLFFCPRGKYCIRLAMGAFNQAHYLESRIFRGEGRRQMAFNRFLFLLLEDIPQFMIQMLNNFYSGSTMTWIAVFSPVSSFVTAVFVIDTFVWEYWHKGEVINKEATKHDSRENHDYKKLFRTCGISNLLALPLYFILGLMLYALLQHRKEEDFPLWARGNFCQVRNRSKWLQWIYTCDKDVYR